MVNRNLSAVIPAAGIGKRVGATIPKQYLPLLNKTIIEHSLAPFLAHPAITRVIVSLAENDQWFSELPVAKHPKIETVVGGTERVDSVLAALNMINDDDYVLVHDAARPCIRLSDINKLINEVEIKQQGAILASQVRDTMKRSDTNNAITKTVERDNLWHALTPQMFINKQLINAINESSQAEKITDEASALEMSGLPVSIVEGRSDNLKVTREEDLKLAAFYLAQGE
ncbi:2-C-methyl-D-erythritol 4-phosphate cytidylyltransferase [Psychromonas sp. Urea-02u-13]|uniref:2-C-methyl-D-erythritol 4-phosphate cytidylyltransferase n=1 Tax=Psychromonas sp. Urea-02u-13 TaxID=2058326 RepID=UPI000C31CE02|nr:2-C-methyl-D-erythritol 4-phosphate cytidylyltransferase [Psychromonas sp. Urea-02u-13]PKG38150.1 2-C-methyl-D-erythritol 4-phosphate cytidylyltransferase [Psychromonas sp. Urea-02u-13]